MTKQLIAFPKWLVLPSLVGGVVGFGFWFYGHRENSANSNVNASAVQAAPAQTQVEPELGLRYELTYEQWVKLLAQEAAAIAQKQPDSLYILAGDSLSLWFPAELLPTEGVWLNQGISGETSYGLLRRLKFFDQTRPKTIFLMIGINDLIRGVRQETLVANHREIIRHLKTAHPNARIIVQSILPHGGDRTTQRYRASIKGDPAPEQNPPPLWIRRLPKIPNQKIRKLNQRIELVVRAEKVEFLDLQTLFTDDQGNLHDNLTTDGLHLSSSGYELWRSQLEQAISNPAKTAVSP